MVQIKWEPFRDLMTMQDRMTRLFDETLARIWKEEAQGAVWTPPVDILEREKEVVLKVDLPEMVQSEIDIKVEENTLVIQGERRFVKETEDANYLQIERPMAPFTGTSAFRERLTRRRSKHPIKMACSRSSSQRRRRVSPGRSQWTKNREEHEEPFTPFGMNSDKPR